MMKLCVYVLIVACPQAFAQPAIPPPPVDVKILPSLSFTADATELEALKSELRAAIVKEMGLIRSQLLGAKSLLNEPKISKVLR